MQVDLVILSSYLAHSCSDFGHTRLFTNHDLNCPEGLTGDAGISGQKTTDHAMQYCTLL